MKQSRQSTAAQTFNLPRRDSSSESDAASRFLLASADEAVRQALAPPEAGPEGSSRSEGATAGNRREFPHYHVRNGAHAPLAVSFPPPIEPAPRSVTLHALQEWEGYVVAIEADEFLARLVDLTAGASHESEEATIPLVEISERDAHSMTIGSIFRWVIGYERSPEGTRKRVSQIVFRDLPRMTEADHREGMEWAHKIAPLLNP